MSFLNFLFPTCVMKGVFSFRLVRDQCGFINGWIFRRCRTMVKGIQLQVEGEVGSNHTHTHTHTYARTHTYFIIPSLLCNRVFSNELRTCNSSQTSLPFPK